MHILFWHDLARNSKTGSRPAIQTSQWLFSKVDGHYLLPFAPQFEADGLMSMAVFHALRYSGGSRSSSNRAFKVMISDGS